MSMFENLENSMVSDGKPEQPKSLETLPKSPEKEISLEQLKEWKLWMDGQNEGNSLLKLINDKAKELNKRQLGGLELRELIENIPKIADIEAALESGKFCYGGKRLIYAVHETSFNTISKPVEGRGFSYSYHEMTGEEDSGHPVDSNGDYIDVADGNGDFSLMYVSEEGKEALVVDTDGHGVYADAASRLFTLYLELSRKLNSEKLENESDILDASFKETDRFMAKMGIESEKKPTSLVILKTRYDETRENKTLSAGIVGTCGFMWIEPSNDGRYVLKAPVMDTVAEEFASVDSFKSVVSETQDRHILPFLGMDLSEDMTMLELKRLQGKFSEDFALKDVATVKKGTWIMAYSDGLMDCERFDKEKNEWVKLENELPKVWDEFLRKSIEVPGISLDTLQKLWVERLSYIVEKAFVFHEKKREFMRRYKDERPGVSRGDLHKAWKRELAYRADNSDDMYDSTDDMTLIVL